MKILGQAILIWLGTYLLFKFGEATILEPKDEKWTAMVWATLITIGIVLAFLLK